MGMGMLFMDIGVIKNSVVMAIEATEDELIDILSIDFPSEEKILSLMSKETDYLFRKNLMVLRSTPYGFEVNTHLDIDYVQDVLEDMLLNF